MSTPTLVTCPQCKGEGREGFEPQGWWHGSGVNAIDWPCPICQENGVITEEERAALPPYCKTTTPKYGIECGYTQSCYDCGGI